MSAPKTTRPHWVWIVIWIAMAFWIGTWVCTPPPRALVTRLDWARTHGVALGALHVAQQARDKPEPVCDHTELDQRVLNVWCALAYAVDRLQSQGRKAILPRTNPWNQPRCDICAEGYDCNQTRHGADWRR